MKNSLERDWKSLLLISIILPVGVLVSVKLAGLLQEPLSAAQIINVDTVSWNMTRYIQLPQFYPRSYNVNKTVTNNFNQGSLIVNLTLFIDFYAEDLSPYGGDTLWVRLDGQVAGNGSVKFLEINFSRIDDQAFLDLDEDSDHLSTSNLKIDMIKDSFDTDQPFIHSYGLNSLGDCSLQTRFWWIFQDPNSLDHSLTVTMQTTYFNGTDIVRVNLPIRLEIIVE